MAVECIDPISDARVKHCNATLNGRQYRSSLAKPAMSRNDLTDIGRLPIGRAASGIREDNLLGK